MATPAATGGNAQPPRAVMMSIADIAKAEGVKKPGVSRRVKRLREQGLYVEIDGQGRVVAVDKAHYDKLKNRYGDPAKVQSAAVPEGDNESYNEARRVLTWTQARQAELELLEQQGKLLPIDSIEQALSGCGERIVRSIERLMASVDDMAAAVARDGTAGLRAELKKQTHRIRGDIADALADIATGAPEKEPDPE